MAEKRKLPARERREPAAKRRVSEAISESSNKRKKSTPSALNQTSTPVAEPTPERQATPEPIEEPLPTKIKDADPLPTRIKAQPSLTLSDKEYQSFAESAMLSISLDRSKKKWLSDGIFERYWTKPKKTKREQLEGKNPPKDSMTKIGPCKIIIEPHHFDGMIYTVKDPNAKPTVQITPPQRHIIHYGPPPPQAGYQYQHYAPPQQMRPPPYPYNQPPNTQQAPSRPPHPPQPVPRQPPTQVQGPPPQPAKPSPDPVIQMLATRAASDPELKALMRIVASSKATQEQLRIFQGHIDELNAIIRQRERQQQQYYQQNPQAPRPQTTQNSQTPPVHPAATAPQQAAQKPAQQNPQQSQTVPTPSSTPAPAPPFTPQSSSTPVPTPSTVKPQSPQSGAQAPPQANNFTKPESAPQAAPSAAQSSNSNADTSTPIDTPKIKTEPGTSTGLVAAPAPAASAPPTTTPPAAAPKNAASNAPAAVPPPSTAPVSTPTAPSPAPSPAPYNAPKVSPAPNYGSANPPPQPLSPYPPGPSQQYHTPYYPSGPPPIKARGAPPNYGPSNTFYQSVPAPPAPKPPIKAVVFEFTSPLTPYGSSTSGHAGSGDRYLFPEYTILEYQAGGTVLLASFLLIRKVDPNTKFPLELAADIAPKTKSKASKSKKKDKGKAAEQSGHSTPAPDGKEADEANAAAAPTDEKKQSENSGDKEETATTTEQPKKEEPSNLKEYYQPITMRFYSSKPATLEPLSRIVKPADEVRKYMEEVMERAERAPGGFLPFRLPREKPLEIVDEAEATTVGNTSAAVGDDAKSRTRDESSAVATPRDIDYGGDGAAAEDLEQDDLEFLLKDHYDVPSGLVPIRA